MGGRSVVLWEIPPSHPRPLMSTLLLRKAKLTALLCKFHQRKWTLLKLRAKRMMTTPYKYALVYHAVPRSEVLLPATKKLRKRVALKLGQSLCSAGSSTSQPSPLSVPSLGQH